MKTLYLIGGTMGVGKTTVLSKNIQAISLYENFQFEECAKRMRLKL